MTNSDSRGSRKHKYALTKVDTTILFKIPPLERYRTPWFYDLVPSILQKIKTDNSNVFRSSKGNIPKSFYDDRIKY